MTRTLFGKLSPCGDGGLAGLQDVGFEAGGQAKHPEEQELVAALAAAVSARQH